MTRRQMDLRGALRRRLLEPFWLGAAISRAEATPTEARARVRELGLAARRRARAARRLRSDEHDIAALALEREAFCYAVSALEASDAVLSPSAAWERYQTQIADPSLGAVLGSDDPLALEGLAPRPARRARLAVEAVLDELLARAEPRSPAELRVSRALRSSGLGLVVASAIGLALWSAFAPHHVGRYKPVTSSSLRAASQPMSLLSDGDVGASDVSSTNADESPWVRLDLLGRYRVVRVVLHPGVATPTDMFPLLLEVADADERYREVGSQTAPLGPKDVFRVELDGRPVRYVRLRHPGRGSILASELDVLAK